MSKETSPTSIKTVPNAKNEWRITVYKDDPFSIDLESSPGTGYMWEYVTLGKGMGDDIELVGSTFAPMSHLIIGGKGKQTFTFIAHEPGTIQFIHWRAWEDQIHGKARVDVDLEPV